MRLREAAGVSAALHFAANLGSRSRFKTRIRNIAQLREHMWHLNSNPLLTLSLQAFPTEFERNPYIYLPTMNSTRTKINSI